MHLNVLRRIFGISHNIHGPLQTALQEALLAKQTEARATYFEAGHKQPEESVNAISMEVHLTEIHIDFDLHRSTLAQIEGTLAELEW